MAQPEGFVPDVAAATRQVEAGTTGTPTMPSVAPASGFTPDVAAGKQGPPSAAQPRTISVSDLKSGKIRMSPEQAKEVAQGEAGLVGDFVTGSAGMVGQVAGAGLAGPAVGQLAKWGGPKVAVWLTHLPMGIARIILGAVGDEVASDVTGREPGAGAIEAGIGGTAGEAISFLGSRTWPVRGMLKEGAAKRTAAARSERAQQLVAERNAARPIVEANRTAITTESEAGTALRRAMSAEEKAHDTALVAQGRAARAGTDAREAAGAEATARLGARTNAARVGQSIEEAVPPLAGARTGEQLSNLGTNRGSIKIDQLGPYQMARLRDAEQMLPERTLVHVPALAERNPAWAPGGQALKDAAAIPGAVRRDGTIEPWALPTLIDNHGPPEVTSFPLREVAERLKAVGMTGYRGAQAEITTRTADRVDWRRTYSEAMRQIEGDLSNRLGMPQAWEAFREGRHAFSVGTTLLRVLKNEGIFERLPHDATYLTIGKLQDVVRKNADQIKARTTDDEWRSIREVVFMGRDVSQSTGVVRVGPLASEAAQARVAAQSAESAARGAGQTAQAASADRRTAGITAANAARRTTVTKSEVEAARQRIQALRQPLPPTYPWDQKAWGRIFLDAALTRAVQESGMVE